MATSSRRDLTIRSANALTVDEQIAQMVRLPLGEVVVRSEGGRAGIGPDSREGTPNAASYLVCRLLTDAIFSQDIRAIQLIINRVDGGLPKDVEIEDYQTQFSDCLGRLMESTRSEQLSVQPSDSVMMGICKALFSLATQDIYWNERTGSMRRRPPTDMKQERDAAMRIILDRLGGRKTLVSAGQRHEDIEEAEWISCLPSGV